MQEHKNVPYIFGVRHLSPGGAFHLRRFLEDKKPTAVLIEGISDANSQMDYFTSKETILPIAILAYTKELPVRTILYPFAEYSPEYQAILWAKENKSFCSFIDLPSDIFISLEYRNDIRKDEKSSISQEGEEKRYPLYEKMAEFAGESNYQGFWEKNFEHNLNKDSYYQGVNEFGKNIRILDRDFRWEGSEFRQSHAENLVREAYMRRKIVETINMGHSPEKIVVVTGAYHSTALDIEKFAAMSDEELGKLPRVATSLTLMPYSYLRLSSRTGYGAGNEAPLYYEMMWEAMNKGELASLSTYYLSHIALNLRNKGTHRSSADVIEGVRLANTLAALSNGSAPTLYDLRDAATVSMGYGDKVTILEALANTEVGIKIGSLPQGVSRTSLQDDFYRELKTLKLEKYKSSVAMELILDLRENRRVSKEDLAFLDLARSRFLHKLKVLKVCFQKLNPNKQDTASWAENWVLQWSPEAEIQLVESTLKGETLETAVGFCFKESLEECVNVADAAAVIRDACLCGLEESMEQARVALQSIAVETGAFAQIASALFDISVVLSYGSIRKIECSHLEPLLAQLFLRGALLLNDASSCDNLAAKEILDGMHKMNLVALEHFKIIDEEIWIKKLLELSERDDKNSKLSGYSCGILLERNIIGNTELGTEVSRRLSPGIDADLGAGWFEGLSLRNRYALIARLSLWEELSNYIMTLEDEQFKRALVFLRRGFSDFSPNEKRSISENLGEIWGVNEDSVSEYMDRELKEDEGEVIKAAVALVETGPGEGKGKENDNSGEVDKKHEDVGGLNDFDFDDI